MTTLFDILDTRTQAGHRAASRTHERWRQILGLLIERGPLTCGQIADYYGLSDNAISGRFGADDPSGLRYNGYAERTGETRKAGGRGAAEVWRITEAGRRWIQNGVGQ